MKSTVPNFPQNQFSPSVCVLLLFCNIFVQSVIGCALHENWPFVAVFRKVKDSLPFDCIVFQLFYSCIMKVYGNMLLQDTVCTGRHVCLVNSSRCGNLLTSWFCWPHCMMPVDRFYCHSLVLLRVEKGPHHKAGFFLASFDSYHLVCVHVCWHV